MNRSVRVAIVEDDPFSSSWLALLLARDWRTYIACEVKNAVELAEVLQDTKTGKIDFILLDTEMPRDSDWLRCVLDILDQQLANTKVLALATHVDNRVVRQIYSPQLRGYLLKQEIHHSIAWAVAYAAQGNWVMTPGVESVAFQNPETLFPDDALVVDGRVSFYNLSQHETDAARMALLFSMERREMANELGITEDWSYGLVHEVYKKIGLNKVLENGADITSVLKNQPIIRRRLERIIAELETRGKSHRRAKALDLEALAFHLLTIPDIY